MPTTGNIESLGAIFVDPSAYSDPRLWHEKAARIRAESPILKVSVEGYPSFWAITTHADVLEIERNHDIFTNVPLPVLGHLQGEADSEGRWGQDVGPDGWRGTPIAPTGCQRLVQTCRH